MSNEQLEKLKAEEAELEAKMLGTPSDPETAEATTEELEVTPRTEEELEADEYMMDTITGDQSEPEPALDPEPEPVVTQEPSPQKPKRVNWKKRFVNYKSSTDSTIYGLRQELMDMKRELARLMEDNQQLSEVKREEQGDLFDGAFTQEDEDTFGSEGLDVVKKAAKVAIERQVKPLQEELRKQEKLRLADLQRRNQGDRNEHYQRFLSNLSTLVPDYGTVNKDPKFLAWLDQSDDYSGQKRQTLFRRAESTGDVARVADFFMDYKRSQNVVADATNIPKAAAKHITPTGSGGGPAPPKQPQAPGYYKESDINKFYRDLMKGRYEGQQGVIMATEKAIEQAYLDRRVLRGQ